VYLGGALEIVGSRLKRNLCKRRKAQLVFKFFNVHAYFYDSNLPARMHLAYSKKQFFFEDLVILLPSLTPIHYDATHNFWGITARRSNVFFAGGELSGGRRGR
jgi:hypothetical protein